MRQFSTAGDPAGYEKLRVAIAEFSRRTRGIHCTPSQVVVTMGATQALDLIARTVAQAGDVALIEEPSDPRVRGTFANARLKTVPMPVDQHGAHLAGVNPAALPPRGPQVIYVTPVRQYPLGVSLASEREEALVRAADTSGGWLVELEGTLSVKPPRRPIVAGRDINARRVIYHASLSWVLFRSLRIGYIIAPDDLVPALVATRQFMDAHPLDP